MQSDHFKASERWTKYRLRLESRDHCKWLLKGSARQLVLLTRNIVLELI